MRRSFLLLGLVLLLGSPARAATIDPSGSNLNGSTVTDLLGGPGTLSLEIDIGASQPIELAVDTEAGESAIAFDALVLNFLSSDLAGVTLALSGGAVFSVLGDAADSLGRAAGVSGGGADAAVAFAVPEPTLLTLGDPLGSGATSWEIDASGVTAGGFGLTLQAVPEPGTLGLLLAATLALRLRRP